MAAPNIAQTYSIIGKTDVQVVGTGMAAITTNPSGSGCVYKVNLLLAANVNETVDVDISAALRRGGNDYHIAKIIAVPLDGSLVLIGKENPIYLHEGDAIVLQSEFAANIHAICSYEIITDQAT